jgi:serine/threonine protein kinase
MRYGKWNVIRELDKGGQATAYIALDSTLVDFENEIWPEVKNSVLGITSISTEGGQLNCAKKLVETIARYLEANREDNSRVVKVLHAPIQNNPKAKERLTKEVEILSKNLHPNILKIVDSSVSEGWFVTPYYPLGNLSLHKDKYQGKPHEALLAIRPLVEAVATIHAINITHRDIKPENIFVTNNGLILGDFGIAHLEDKDNTRISETYENVGSRDWMPAWAMGMRLEDVRPSFDVFGLGKVLWSMVSGRTKLRLWYYNRPEFDLTRLFPADERMFLINKILARCLVENEEDCKYPSAQELITEIDEAISILQRGGQVIDKKVTRMCRVCGIGCYKERVDKDGRLIRGTNARFYVCQNCGHDQTFVFDPPYPASGDL